MARLDQQKQLDHAIKAFAEVITKVPDARLEIYGRGVLQGELNRLIRNKGLSANVRLAGFTDDPMKVYRGAGLSLLTSRYEGFGLVLVESLQQGCPVVSYDLRYGPSDIIEDGVNGFLVPYGDQRAMADTIVRCLTEPGLLARLSSGTVPAVRPFTPESCVARWSGLYNELDAQGWAESS